MLPVRRPELDAIYWQTIGRKARTVCVAAANPGEGVSALSLALARRGATSGLKALLIDANLLRPSISAGLGLPPACWSPADGSAQAAITFVEEIDIAVLPAPTGVTSLAFRNPEKWQRMLEEELSGYGLIVIDTSPVNSFGDNVIPAESVAAACTVTLLVALTAVTTERSLRVATERLATAGASVGGVVFNDRFNPTLGDELCRQLDRFARFAPRTTGRLRRWIERSAILNLQA